MDGPPSEGSPVHSPVARPCAALLPALLVAAVLTVLTAPAASAAPETVVREDGRVVRAVALERRVEARQHLLSALNRRADARERSLLGRARLLATYGWHGAPGAASAVLPLATYHLSAGFGLTGPLWEAEHGGQDFGAGLGEPIVAVAAGTVTEVAYAGPYGLRTVVTLPDGTEVWYCHQSEVSVVAGQRVDLAEEIGRVGSTGNSTAPHLHLELRPGGGAPVDPVPWLVGQGLTP